MVWSAANSRWEPGTVASSGGSGSSSGSTTTTKPERLLESLNGVADGRTVVDSGSYTLENVTSTQITTTSYADITEHQLLIHHQQEQNR